MNQQYNDSINLKLLVAAVFALSTSLGNIHTIVFHDH